nr:Chain A, Outer capsid protein VP4 [Porcine rotavirus A]5YMU_B Chain B, Outer capsid protein VP4 [Porcine rotavirus A]5YMU_C Chain C, Outer capsid protein VP4 [Porcine rotavirus A]5YMU_D Chain D, Outer capsid protein VP4 [Porcine rotavirus A]
VLDGPYQPTRFKPPNDYWILLSPTNQQVVLEGTNRTDVWVALLLVEPNVTNQSRQYTLFGETKQITVENNTNKWKFYEMFRNSASAEFQHKRTLTSDTKLAGFLKHGGRVWTFYGETPHATTDYSSTSNLSEVETVIRTEFYIIPRSQESKCNEYINTGL